MITELDSVDAMIIKRCLVKLDSDERVRVGDYVIFTDDVVRRVSYVWRDETDAAFSVQTSDGGSFHLGDGYVSFSGSLHPGVSPDTLTRTDDTRDGAVWIFHHDRWTAHNGIDAVVPFRVYRCSERS